MQKKKMQIKPFININKINKSVLSNIVLIIILVSQKCVF